MRPRPPRTEITDGLNGRTVVPAAKTKGTLLELPLKADAAEHIPAPVRRRHLHEQGAVRYPRVAAIVAHPVRHEPPRLRRRRDHHAAGAHTKRIHAALARLIAVRHRIVGDGQLRTARCRTVLHAVDERLRMLDAHADSKRLCLHTEPRIMQHRICVTRRVSNPEECGIGRNPLRIVHNQSCKLSRTQLHVRHLRTEAHLASHADDLVAQMLHHASQQIRPDMRLLEISDLLGGACRDERLDDLVHTRVIAARRQLPIRERPRPALAELHIRCGIEHARLPEARHIRRAPIHILPAL